MGIDTSGFDDVVRDLGITDEEASARKAFLDFHDDDIARLKALHRPLENARAEIINEFYAHLLSFDGIGALLGDDDSVMRLKRMQSAYFDGLTAGEYGADYVRGRLRVGTVHQQIGLDYKWYLGAYNKYLGSLFSRLWRAGEPADRATLEAILSLLKIVFFDIGLATDTFLHDRQRKIERKLSQLAALNRVAVAVTSSLELQQVLDEVLRCAAGLTGSRASCIAFFDQAEGRFTNWVTHGLSGHFVDNMTFRPGGLADETFTSGAPVLSNDLPGTRHQLSALVRQEGIRSFLCLPLQFRDQHLGVLYVYRDDREDFLADDVSLLQTFAHLAAGAIYNARLHAEVTNLARTDGLTGLHNRRSFDERLDLEVQRGGRYRNRFALLMLDLDHFKRVNDAYGHGAGDAVLKFVGGLLRRHTRAGVDMAARIGGEEFLVLLSETDTGGALVVAEKMRGELEGTAMRVSDETQIRVTASIGVCCYPRGGNTAEMLIRNADAALYAAKQGGRNRAMAFGT